MLIHYGNPNLHAMSNKDGSTIATLKPGWNEFPSDIWNEHKNHPEILKMLDKGEIKLMEEKVVVKGKKVVLGKDDTELSLKLLSEEKAIEIVKATFNREMLQRFEDEENRSKVKRVIEKQLAPLRKQED